MIFNAGFDAKITPKLRSQFNVNYCASSDRGAGGAVVPEPHRHEIATTPAGLQYRPLLSENIVWTGGFSLLKPGTGFKNVYTKDLLYSGFVQMRLLF
jgi:hypothetical protein